MTGTSKSPQRLLRATDKFTWPGRKRVAIVFNIAFEAWSDGEAPGIGPMGNVLKPGYFDTNAHSWANYGIVRGIQRLQRIADRRGIKTSVMTNGVIAERAPQAIRALQAAEHDVCGHSWGMDVIPVYLDEEGQRANIARTTEALADVLGEKPVGWISPRGTGSLIHERLLAEAGYLWHGDCNDDDLPTIADYDGRRIVGIPLTMDVNDLPHSIRYGNQSADLITHLATILDFSAKADWHPFMLDITAHTHVYGRPAGAFAYDEMIELVQQRGDVWIATRREIADYALLQADRMFA